MSSSSPDKFVFLDLGGKRWPRTRRLVVLLGLLLFVASVFFVQSLLIAPPLVLPLKLKKLKEQLKALQKQGPLVPNTAAANEAAVRNFYRSPAGKDRLKALRDQLTAKPARPAKAPGQVRLAYTVAWDPSSYDSLVAHADKITHVCPEWFTLTRSDGTFSGENDVQLLQFLGANKRLVLLPLMTNLSGDARVPEAVENLAHGPAAAQQRFIDELKHQLGDIHAGGVLIDWEGIDAAYENDLTKFLAKVADGLHDANLELWLQIPVGEERHAYDIETLSDSVDYFVASLHDQVSEDDPPGPVAAENWFRSWLDAVASYQEPAQWIISIGNYGYDWEQDTSRGAARGGKRRTPSVSPMP